MPREMDIDPHVETDEEKGKLSRGTCIAFCWFSQTPFPFWRTLELPNLMRICGNQAVSPRVVKSKRSL